MFQTDHTGQVNNAGNIKKCALSISLALGLGGLPTASNAALSGSTLSFNLGTVSVTCNYGTTPPCNKTTYSVSDIVGSYFSMDTGANGMVEPSEKTPIGSFNGIAMGGPAQSASGSHSGGINGTENPNIDAPWEFFGNTGMHQTTSPVTVTTPGETNIIDMSGWNVTWNGIPSIPLVGGPAAAPPLGPLPPATIKCETSGCSHGETYVLDGAFHVSGAGFTTVSYTVHLEGFVAAQGQAPIAVDDSAKTIVGNAVPVSVTSNDASAANPKYTAGSVVSTDPANGSTTDNADNTVTYTPAGTTAGTDAFNYTVANAFGRSPAATASIDIQDNVAPEANDDTAAFIIAAFENANGMVDIPATANDTDVNNLPGLPGGINTDTLKILSQPPAGEGTCTANADGSITYSQTPPFIIVSTSCTYEVMDIDDFAGGAGPLTSNVATVNIDITPIESDWPERLDPDIIPYLLYAPGVPNTEGEGGGNDSTKPPLSGSYFTMDISTETTIHVIMEGAAAGGMVVGHQQTAGNSHQSLPTGFEPAIVEKGWNFFGNTGYSYTVTGGIFGNPDGTLQFSGAEGKEGPGLYFITWNGIPAIDLGGSPLFFTDVGFGIITCSEDPCAHDSTFSLVYDAHVPKGDPSGFGGVLYGLRTEGVVGFLDGRPQTDAGTISFDRLVTDDMPADADFEPQCVGDCFDYTVTGVAPGSSVSVVVPLAGGVPADVKNDKGEVVPPVLRVLKGAGWGSFITSDMDEASSDTVMSAQFIAGGDFGLVCPPPGDAAYRPMTADDQCLEITIEDNGPNDKDPADGTIMDPSGIGIPFFPFVDTRKSGDSGCTVATRPVSPTQGGAWWILAGFVAWLGWNRRKRKQH